jgi:hypothetical protein
MAAQLLSLLPLRGERRIPVRCKLVRRDGPRKQLPPVRRQAQAVQPELLRLLAAAMLPILPRVAAAPPVRRALPVRLLWIDRQPHAAKVIALRRVCRVISIRAL